MKKLLIIIGVTVGLNTGIVAGPIHDAAHNGDIDEIKSLLNIGVSVDHKDENSWTALMISIASNDFETADFLVSVGADVNVEDNYGKTPIFKSFGDMRNLNLLINNGADVSHQDKSGRTPLMSADNVQAVSVLINNGAEIDVKDIAGMTALHYALYSTIYHSEKDHLGVITILLENKADINAKDRFGRTPLEYQNLLYRYSASVFELLQQAGAKSGLRLLEEKVDQLSTGTTNPTDEWPRKMWEIDLPAKISLVYDVVVGSDGKSLACTLLYENGNNLKNFWFDQFGELYELPQNFELVGPQERLLFFDSKNLVYEQKDHNIIMFYRDGQEVKTRQFKAANLGRSGSDISTLRKIGVEFENNKLTAWDFTPPSNTVPNPDGANGGGNETANSRLIIKTAGPDISLATDGKLGGAAELQKSNDLRSWRRLGDVPEEASEVLVTPRERGNEFYRLKKK